MYICFQRNIQMEKLSKELIGASSMPIILSILSKNESYGYEIIQSVKEISNGRIEYGDGTLYPVLHKLEKKGLIESYWKVGETSRKRKYYKISKTGKKELSQEKENWAEMNKIISKLWKIEPSLA
jgi:PadR family transcriptional regulator PadR